MRKRSTGIRQLGRVMYSLVALALLTEVAWSQEHIAYWHTHYKTLTATEDPRVVRAQAIFERLVQSAEIRHGVVPRLLILQSDPWGFSLPIALADGWIILSKGVLDLCYRDAAWGDDRLAFVMAHEIAHLRHDDFWHLRFFQAIEAVEKRHDEQRLKALLQTSEEDVQRRELSADRDGMIYAAMAGFNPAVLMTATPHVNFFQEWLQARTPHRRGSAAASHPLPQQRAEALRVHLSYVVDQAMAFHAGLLFYYAGNYAQALQAFASFLTVFPSREVFHNLAASHHQLALQLYQVRQSHLLPFRLSVAVDPLTRASQLYLDGPTRGEQASADELSRQFSKHLDEAIRFYREALGIEATYVLSALNLGAALILRGVHAPAAGLQPDFSEAVTILSRALQQAPDSSDLLTNLGVALFYEERPERARDMLMRASQLAPDDPGPALNLAMIMARTPHAPPERPLAAPPGSPAAVPPQVESVDGITLGSFEETVPAHWGKATRTTISLGTKTFVVANYPIGITSLSRDREILMLLMHAKYQGHSEQGIAVGSRAADIVAHYGLPARRHTTTQGANLSYDTQRIAFQLRADQVVSWLLF